MIRAKTSRKLGQWINETLRCHYLASALIRPDLLGLPHPVARS